MLPKKNDAISSKFQGEYLKFHVNRVDGSDKDQDVDYFVLDLDNDPYAILALRTYIDRCKDEYPFLAQDLTNKINEKEATWMKNTNQTDNQ